MYSSQPGVEQSKELQPGADGSEQEVFLSLLGCPGYTLPSLGEEEEQ